MNHSGKTRRVTNLLRPTPPKPLAWAFTLCLAGALTLPTPKCLADELPPAASREVDFARDVLPLLQSHCFRCHAGAVPESGVRLDARRELLGETNGVPLVRAGRSEASRLVQLIAGQDPRRRMPPPDDGKPLDAQQIGLLRAWIDQGMKWDDRALPPPIMSSDHWAFQPIRATSPPTSARREWPLTAVDSFIAAAHDRQGLVPAPPAPSAVRLRRLTLDLTGLPPTAEELDSFRQDEASESFPDVWSRQVDRLLASPAYGERWGRHWLDVARWAESEGYESNHARPYAWRYRDYVIRAFNDDLPYDQFLREQLAGDELPNFTDEQLIATGFLAGARLSSNEEDKTLQRGAVLFDIVNVVGEGVLGLTFACAQCHNHKFDPLTQRDYYRLQAYFVAGQPGNLTLRDAASWARYEAAKPADYEPAVQLRQALEQRAREKLLAERRARFSPETRAALAKPASERDPAEQELSRLADLELQFAVGQIERAISDDDRTLHETLKKKIAEIEKTLPDKPQTWGYFSPRTASRPIDVLPMQGFYPLPFDPEGLRGAQAFLLVRGDVHRRGPALAPGVPELFEARSSSPRGPEAASTFATRSQLVDWLTSPTNPLTARVWANRLWQYHFGRGIVATSGDFGVKGAAPSHPELLDFLAANLIDDGWSAKRLHRQIVLSSTFQQSSIVDAARRANDPENRALARWSPRRLEAEAMRDSLLAVGDRLDRTSFGPSSADPAARRRAIYLRQLRDRPPETQRLFDGPTANESCSRRHVSTVALQPLYLLNHPLAIEAAVALAERVARGASDDERRVELAFRWTLARAPDDVERAAALEFLAADSPHVPAAADTSGKSPPPLSRLAAFCQTLLNLNEFHYVE